MFSRLVVVILALALLPAHGDPYSESWPAVIQLHVYGTLKEPDPDTHTVDFHERGTGFVVSPDGLVLSAGHMIPSKDLFDEDGFYVEGYFPEKDVDALNAVDPPVQLKVINAKESPYDVALLQIKDLRTVKPFLRLCDAYLKQGRPRFQVLGYQGGDRQLTINEGPVMSGAGAVSNIVVQIPLNPGNSGGPIFNELGMVFGIAIGERTVGGQRMQSSSLAVPMAKAIATLKDDAKPLIGVSYDPDCTKPLNPRITTVLSESVQIRREAPVDVISAQGGVISAPGGVIPAPGGAIPAPGGVIYMPGGVVTLPPVTQMPIHTVGSGTTHTKVPDGYKVIQAGDVRFDRPGINGSVRVSNDGRMLTIGGTDIGDESYVVTSNVPVLLEQVPSQNVPSVIQTRTFPYSMTLDDHGFTVTSRNFQEAIPAPEGFKFKEVIKIEYESLNHSPSNGATVTVSADGSRLDLKYTLESGPAFDQWRGWIDAFITATVIRKL